MRPGLMFILKYGIVQEFERSVLDNIPANMVEARQIQLVVEFAVNTHEIVEQSIDVPGFLSSAGSIPRGGLLLTTSYLYGEEALE